MKVTFEFHPASSPPDVDTTVFLFNGDEFFCGWYDDGESPYWFDMSALPVTGVVAWAHMPDAGLFAQEGKR